MSAKVFIDSNVLIYTYSDTEPEKKIIAQQLVIEKDTFISTQVLQELANIITKKFGFSYLKAIQVIKECSFNSDVHINSINTVLQACEIAERYLFSFYDSLIISAAIESKCSILYTEDLNDGQLVFDSLKIINPFK